MKKVVATILCLSLMLLSFPMSANAVGSSYDISVFAGEGGKIALTVDGLPENGAISVDEGSNVTFYIIPDSHYSIEDVMADGASQGAVTQYTFNNVTAGHNINASFTRNTKTITVASVANGEILINGSGENGTAVTVDEGSEADIAVRPGTGYEIASVTIGAMTYSLDGEIGDRTGEFSRTVTVNDNISVSAVFRLAQHTIITNVGPNGTVSPMNPQVNHGSDQTFTITPNSGYSIRSLTVDGNSASVNDHNQITLSNVQGNRMMSVDFAQNVTYTITTIAGPNGSVTPGNPVVAQGSDVTFTITPNPGYIIDELRVEGLPEMPDEHNQFTIYNVQRSMTLQVSFMESVTHTIIIPKPVNGNIQIVGETDPVPVGGSVVTSRTGEMMSYYIAPNKKHKINKIIIHGQDGQDADVTYDFYYDETAKKIRIDVETMSSYTLEIRFVQSMSFGRATAAILKNEAATVEGIKAAVRRELGLLGFDIPLEEIFIEKRFSYVSDNGVPYEVIFSGHPDHHRVDFYVLERHTDIMMILTDWDPQKAINSYPHVIVSNIEALSRNGQIEVPTCEQGATIDLLGVYAAGVEGIITKNTNLRCDGRYGVYWRSPFYRAQIHFTNKNREEGKQLNWFPLTIIQQSALCINVQATSESGTQETFTWELDTYPHLTVGDSTQEVFFGNDRVILEKPRNGIGDIANMRAAASNSPGYTFKNNSDGTITIDFMSDYYDKVTVPLTIVKQSGGTVKRSLTIHRVGVDIQAHNAADGNPSPTRTVFHGTQYGNLVNFADGKKYKITASYFIPDYGNNRPYGLYVTRKYANGKTETQIITQPMASPHPASADLFDPVKKVFIYNDGSRGMANAADYLIYSGSNADSAPVEISVLVLKNAPAAENNFGGVDYGSGTGVKWTKP